MTNWNALLGTDTNVAVSGLVALTSSNVETKTAKDPKAPHHIINQKKGTSRKGMFRMMCGMPPEKSTTGERRRMDRRDV